LLPTGIHQFFQHVFLYYRELTNSIHPLNNGG